MIGVRLMELRKRAGLSQRQLGDELDVSHYTISAYEKERSEPADSIKVRIARYFGVSADYLLGLIDTPQHYVRETAAVKMPPRLSATQMSRLADFVNSLEDDNG